MDVIIRVVYNAQIDIVELKPGFQVSGRFGKVYIIRVNARACERQTAVSENWRKPETGGHDQSPAQRSQGAA
jgi:hypothetical protein